MQPLNGGREPYKGEKGGTRVRLLGFVSRVLPAAARWWRLTLRGQGQTVDRRRATGSSAVFVTHSLEKPTILAGRMVVMSPGPGCIVAGEPLMLAQHLNVSSPAFNNIRRHLASLLHADHAREAA